MHAFDPIESMNDLVNAKIPQESAQAIIKVIQAAKNDAVNYEIVATKNDIGNLQSDINLFKISTKNDISYVREDISQAKIESKNDIHTLQEDINRFKIQMKNDIHETHASISRLEIKLSEQINSLLWKLLAGVPIVMGIIMELKHFIG